MKKLFIKHVPFNTALFLLIIFGFSSCSKNLLDTSPDTSLSDATVFETPERISAQVNGLYAGLKSGDFYGGRELIFNELRGDEFLMRKPDPGQASNVWSHTINSGSNEVVNFWSAGYQVINRVNTFLAGLDENKEKVSEETYTQYVAEAKFLRAVAYFALVQFYAKPYNLDNGASPGLPLRLMRENSSANNNLERSTVSAIYNQILTDLNDAEAGLPLTYDDDYLNSIKAHRNTAIAFKTRVYLNKGEYENVIAEAEKIVSLASMSATSGVPNQLETDFGTLFTGNYVGPEALFSMPFGDGNSDSPISFYFRAPPAPGSEYYLNPDGILTNPALTNPNDARSEFVISSQDELWLNKYTTPTPLTDYVPVMRYAEILLNYAEAAARTGDLETAADLLKAVRNRSDEGYTFAGGDLSSQPALINLILTERRIELLGEGFRVPDVQRLLLPIPGKSAPSGISPTLTITSTLYIWPISSEELGTNKLMTPNE